MKSWYFVDVVIRPSWYSQLTCFGVIGWLVGFFFFNALPPGTPGDLKATCMAHGTVDEEWLTLKVVNWL